MSKCENCVKSDVCAHRANIKNDTYAYMGVTYDTENCLHYKDKSLCVEVVRCKDCEHWKCLSLDPIIANLWGECHRPLGDYSCCETSENDYCSYAERKLEVGE
jgi:hypothetical protein